MSVPGERGGGQQETPAVTTSASISSWIRQAKRLTLAPELEKAATSKNAQNTGARAAIGTSLETNTVGGSTHTSEGLKSRQSSHKPRVETVHALLSQGGFSAPRIPKTNQDVAYAIEGWGKEQEALWMCVLDGHGPAGHLVASRVKEKLPLFVAQSWLKGKELHQALTQGYKAVQRDLNKSNIDILCSGTTCVSCVLHRRTLYVANVGDSRAILGRESGLQGGPWTALPLTTDHKPERESERQRILAAGGRIKALLDDDGSPCGPLRVWLPKEDLPGLAMSRSLGDTLAGKAGVIPDPEVGVHTLSSGDRCVLLASDGVWEFLSNEDALEIVQPFVEKGDAAGGCSALVAKAQSRWLEEEEAVDDITALLVILRF
ncbi:protein phosphatase [Cyclospora cayetanensis]|uniref:Protein phosphatase n=1 Tax=Cyclospora cayetanensis TaxID=88456 RepID=A0A1D3CWD7_9EIME|nr:protein phosphatase [Cyclospora cayetanensis]